MKNSVRGLFESVFHFRGRNCLKKMHFLVNWCSWENALKVMVNPSGEASDRPQKTSGLWEQAGHFRNSEQWLGFLSDSCNWSPCIKCCPVDLGVSDGSQMGGIPSMSFNKIAGGVGDDTDGISRSTSLTYFFLFVFFQFV